MNDPINEQYLNRVYDELQREQMRLMTEFKNDAGVDDKDIQKQITMLNGLTMSVLKFRNLKKAILEKKNSC
jgi:DNA-binding transcriptional MerR regulator